MESGGVTPDEPDDERPINVGGAAAIYSDCFPKNLQYVALGHLHRQHEVAGGFAQISYSGSPLAYSFSEENQEKYVCLVEVEPAQVIDFKRIMLTKPKKLLRGRFESTDDALAWLAEHQDALVQLTMVSDSYLDAAENRRLYAAHEGIVGTIIPEIRNADATEKSAKNVDLDRDIEAIFMDYFRQKHRGQEPNDALRQLFKEVLSVQID